MTMRVVRQRIWGLAVVCGVFISAAAAQQGPPLASSSPATPGQHLADYDAELRRPDGRVAIEGMVRRLKELGVTTYYWLVWHAATDWDDLKLFLPRAAEANIKVWVYLVPPSESPPQFGASFSEPFRLDFHRWAEQIARLSLQNPNLTAWVIDDFYANHEFFSPAYLREMQARARRINPRLGFLPLMYFNEITRQFVEDYHPVIDGVVVAYPQDRDEIKYARAILNGETRAMPGQLSCPWNVPTSPGDFARAELPTRVLSAHRMTLRFREQDDFTGPTSGYHVPLIVMTAGDLGEFRHRHGEPASPERMTEWLRMSLQAWHDGQCDGVVTYCLDKEPQSPTFSPAQRLFREFKTNRE